MSILPSSLFAITMTVACASRPPPEPARSPIAGTGFLEHRMANCPSALATAVTRVDDVPGGVAVTVTATDPEARRRLISLADVHARIGGPEGNSLEHTGMHGGPSDIGHCPIIHTATLVSYRPVPGGVRFEVKALPAGDVEALRSATRARVRSLPKWIANQ